MGRRSRFFVVATLLLAGAVGVWFGARSGPFVGPAPDAWTELDDFNQVVLEVAGEVAVQQSDRNAVRVEAPPRARARTELRVADATLFLGYRPARFSLPGQAVEPVHYVVEVVELDAVEATESATVRIDLVEGERFGLTVRNTASVEVATLQVDAIDVQLFGNGRVTLAGVALDQSVSVSQQGAYSAADLRSETARIRIAGDGVARVWVTEALDVDIVGGGSVAYRGRPSITQQLSGAGEVKALNEGD